MKINDILIAKESLTKLNKAKFNDFSLVYKIYKLTKQVNNVLDLVQEEQQKILETYAQKDANGNVVIENNQYKFENTEARSKFIEEIEKLRNSEAEDIVKIDISVKDVQSAMDFSSAELLVLDPIINWID